MQALADGAAPPFFVRHATGPHQSFTNKFGTEQGPALRRQHNNEQSKPEEKPPPLWWAAAEIEDAKDASTPGLAPSFAVNEAAHTSWVSSPNLSWAQQKEGSKYDPAGGLPPNLTPTWAAHSELVPTALKFMLWALAGLGAVSLLYVAAIYCHARSWVLRALVHTHKRKGDVHGPCAM